MNVIARLVRRLFVEPWLVIDRDQMAPGAAVPGAGPPAASGYDWRVVIVLVTVAVSLSLQKYYGEAAMFRKLFPSVAGDRDWMLAGLAWTSAWRVLGCVVLPAITIWLMPGERVRDYYVGLRRSLRRPWLYALLYVVGLPVVVLASQSQGFSDHDPFFALTRGSALDLWSWQLLYAVQFVALEFFYRGYMLRGLGPVMGSRAIFVMMVPFGMDQFGKQPFPEALGAMLIAIVLGSLAMRTRSIWAGVVVHMGMAVLVTRIGVLTTLFSDPWIQCLTWLLLFGGLIAGVAALLVAQWRIIDRDGAVPAAVPAAKAPRRPKKRSRPADSAPAAAVSAVAPLVSPSGGHWRTLVILATVIVSLALQEYYGERGLYQRLFPQAEGDPYWTLKGYAWWSGWRVFGYVVLPAITILLIPGERLRDYYISPRGFVRHLWKYAVLYLMILPAVIIASQTQSFSATYPFYKLANRSSFDFWAWQGLYAVQFLALEIFFRGYMLRGLARVMGSRAIFVMAVPYCMIHFGKPIAETLGAIGAGIILGTLAMYTRSIWGGVAIHVGVAVTMDALALGHCPPAETGQPCRGH